MDYLKNGYGSVSIVMLTRDQDLEYLKKSLDSVLSQIHKPDQVIVVINASCGGTVEFLKDYNLNTCAATKLHSLGCVGSQAAQYQFQPANGEIDLEIIENNYNLGFAKGMNQGIQKAKGDYTLILDSDVMLEPDCLTILLDFIKKEDNVGLLSGYVYDYHNKELIYSGNKVTLGWNFKQSMINESSQVVSTDLIIGGFFLSKTSLLKRFKGFDERYFVYFDDLDLTMRFRKKGFRNLIIPQVRVYHLEKGLGISKYQFDKKIQFELEKNLLITYFKHAQLFWLVLFFMRYMTYSFIKNIFDTRRNIIILKTRFWVICNLADLIKARYFN